MNALPQRMLARGTAIRSTTRQIAASFSIALLTAFVAAQVGVLGPTKSAAAAQTDQTALNSVFAVCAVVAGLSLLLALRYLPRGDEMQRNVKARSTEHKALVGGR